MINGRHNSFPGRFGSRKAARDKALVDYLVESLKFAYSDDEDSFSFAELLAVSKGIEYLNRYINSVKYNIMPGTASFSIDDWRELFGLYGANNKELAGKWMDLENTLDYVEIISNRVFDNKVNSVTSDNSIQYWAKNVNPEAGYDWVGSGYMILINVAGSYFTDLEFEDKRDKLTIILNDILPIYCDFCIAENTTGFLTDEGKLGITALG